MVKRSACAAALVLGLAVSARAQGNPPSQDGKTPFRMGVVNLKTCFEKDKYDRIKEVDADLQRMAAEYAKKVEDIEKKHRDLSDQIGSMGRDVPLRAEKILETRRLETELKFQKEYGRSKYLDYYSDRKMEIYNEIRRVIEMIGKEQGFDLVLRVEVPLLEEQDPENLTQRINNRVVLYHPASVDITPSVLKRLNDEYSKQRAAAGGAEWECKECKKKNRTDACTATPNCKGKKP